MEPPKYVYFSFLLFLGYTIYVLYASEDYYSTIDANARDEVLKKQLKSLISDHKNIPYNDVWQAFADIFKSMASYPCDDDPTNIPDIYSAFCWAPEKKKEGGECGIWKNEGDCFNREHIWPKSWFGGFEKGKGAQTDLFELYPSDGKVNTMRSNLPLGDVIDSEVTYESSNGSRIGRCSSKLFNGKCFEVAPSLKGDIARSYFYLSVAYENEWDCCDEEGVSRSSIKPWMEAELRKWHKQDPVDDYERKRNDVIYKNWQGNRNPFIDHPEWVYQITDF